MKTDLPICGYCGIPEYRHTPQDHPFDVVGGSSCTLIDMTARESAPMSPRRKLLCAAGLASLPWALFFAVLFR